MSMRAILRSVILTTALTAATVPGFAQSQADRTGTGGVAPVAGQDAGSLATTAIVAGAVIAGAIGIAVAVSSDDDENTPSVATVTSTTTR